MFDDARGAVPDLLSALAKASLMFAPPQKFLDLSSGFLFHRRPGVRSSKNESGIVCLRSSATYILRCEQVSMIPVGQAEPSGFL